MNILGISAFYHDSAAALVSDGDIVAAAQQERFSRVKHDAGFPGDAIRYCLAEKSIGLEDLDYICFYDKPLLKFERLLESHLYTAPKSYRSFVTAMPLWLGEKLYQKQLLRRELAAIGACKPRRVPPLLFCEHHQSHAASAFFPSPFERAAILCMDGVGEWATTTLFRGEGGHLTPLWQINFPHSLGLLYSAFTYYLGFKVNSGEYKVMGLAPYGEPRYRDLILEHLIDLRDDGSFHLNMEYFGYVGGLRMTTPAFHELFGAEPRKPESELRQRDLDLASSIQAVTEEAVLRLARTARRETGERSLCLAGGVALNCVANGCILREGIFDDVWIQPAAGDAGGAVGAALSTWYEYCGRTREPEAGDAMRGALLGPSFSDEQVEAVLSEVGACFTRLGADALNDEVASILADGGVVGWMQGRCEFGPRALGARSILGDPRSPAMQSVMNLKIKYRESFRPFAPAVLAERAGECFDLVGDSPYMLQVAPVSAAARVAPADHDRKREGLDRLQTQRSQYPAITHVDYSARVQTVRRENNRPFHDLLSAFERKTGCPMLVNTSFNVRGEPIVLTPADAWRCFMHTEMDALAVGSFLMRKSEQAPVPASDQPAPAFALD